MNSADQNTAMLMSHKKSANIARSERMSTLLLIKANASLMREMISCEAKS